MADPVSRAISNSQIPASTQEVTGGRRSAIRKFTQQATTSGNTLAIQTIAGDELRENQQTVNVVVADRDYYFTLEVLDDAGAPIPKATLQPGTSYSIRTSCSLNRNDLFDPRPVKIAREVLFYLEADPADAVDIQEQEARILIGDALTWRSTFGFSVREEIDAREISFQLVYREAEDTFVQNRAATVRVPIVGAIPGVTRGRLVLPTHVEPPKSTAFVYVESPAPGKLQIAGYTQLSTRKVDSAVLDRPPVPPGPFNDVSEYLSSLQEAVSQFSSTNPSKLGDWFEDVITKGGEQTMIVVVDQADSRIPWEMFRVPAHRYLGARACVVRLAPQGTANTLKFEFDQKHVKGGILAFVQPGDPAMGVVAAPFGDLNDLQYEAPQQKPGLLYVGASQVIHHGSEEAMLDALWNPSGMKMNLPLADLVPFSPLPLVVVDAPYSGFVFSSGGSGGSGHQSSGLPGVMLTRLGCGFIGTVAPVAREDAAEIIGKLIAGVQAAGGANAADLLNEMRREAEETLTKLGAIKKEDRAAKKRKALAVFAYVYYGSPRLCVEVAP